MDRRFERHTRERLKELAGENGLTAEELVALVAEIVPEPSKLRKRVLKDN